MNFDSSPIQQRFFAVYADGREERLSGITILSGEDLDAAVQRVRLAIGATAIVLKPEKQDGAA